MLDPDDWQPLPEHRLAAHPGELLDATVPRGPAGLPAPAACPPTPASATGAGPVTGPDAEAERALAALKQRIAAAPPATSLIAEVQHREQRAERKRRAAAAPGVAEVMHAPPPRDLPWPVEDDPCVDGRDAREHLVWFQNLPASERERLHDVWAHKREQGSHVLATQRRNRNRRFVAAVLCFVAAIVAGTGANWVATLGAGVGCGLWWRHAPPDRFLDPFRALGCLVAAHTIAMVAHGMVHTTMFMDAILLVALAAIVGFDGEIRRSGGFDVT